MECQIDFDNLSVDDVLTGKYISVYQSDDWQEKAVPIILGNIGKNATLSEWKSLNPNMSKNVKEFCLFAMNINSDKHFLQLCDALQSTTSSILAAGVEFSECFKNLFIYNLLSDKKFVDYSFARLNVILPEGSDQTTVDKILSS